MSDRQDEQRPATEDDTSPSSPAAAPWSAEPVRRTDGQRWRCRAVIEIPYDAHLVTGGLIDLDRIAPATRRAYLELSAAVADGFALPPLQRKPAPQA